MSYNIKKYVLIVKIKSSLRIMIIGYCWCMHTS